jgi:hypothetical protein
MMAKSRVARDVMMSWMPWLAGSRFRLAQGQLGRDMHGRLMLTVLGSWSSLPDSYWQGRKSVQARGDNCSDLLGMPA